MERAGRRHSGGLPSPLLPKTQQDVRRCPRNGAIRINPLILPMKRGPGYRKVSLKERTIRGGRKMMKESGKGRKKKKERGKEKKNSG